MSNPLNPVVDALLGYRGTVVTQLAGTAVSLLELLNWEGAPAGQRMALRRSQDLVYQGVWIESSGTFWGMRPSDTGRDWVIMLTIPMGTAAVRKAWLLSQGWIPVR